MDPMQNHANLQDGQGNLPAPNPASPQQAGPAMPGNIPVQQTSQQSISQGQPGGSYSAHSPAIADDVDLIEKEWVVKAKDIVARTKDDPNAQSKDMNRFKADYLKTRYNKDVKVNEA